MKWIYWLCLFCGTALTCGAQTTQEWIHQKQTRIRYAEEQIAALGAYTKEIEKGYKAMAGGLDMINNLKRGDFDLHHQYFSSLYTVSLSVTGYEKVKRMADLQMSILKVSDSLLQLFTSPFLFSSEKHYLQATINALLQKCSADMGHLTSLTLSGKIEITDEQRLNEISNLYQAMQDNYSFAVYEKESTQLLLCSRSSDENNTSALRSIYGLK